MKKPQIVAALLMALIVILALGGAFGVRMLITGGDVQCAFSTDPSLCVAVKGADR